MVDHVAKCLQNICVELSNLSILLWRVLSKHMRSEAAIHLSVHNRNQFLQINPDTFVEI